MLQLPVYQQEVQFHTTLRYALSSLSDLGQAYFFFFNFFLPPPIWGPKHMILVEGALSFFWLYWSIIDK